MTATDTSQPPIRLDEDYHWTPRQKQVLDLIVRGYTNGRIGEELGVSLDGAKWHVSEILSKLRIDTREEAAEYWRAYNGWGTRLTRLFRGFVATGPLRWTATSGAVLAGASGIALAALLWAGNDAGGDEGPQAPASPGVTASPSPDATATGTPASSTATPAADNTSTVSDETPSVSDDTPTEGIPTPEGLFAEPGPAGGVSALSLTINADAHTWPEHDNESTVLYNTVTGAYRDFGPGTLGHFTPDGTRMVWLADGQLWVVDLPDGEPRAIGPATGFVIAVPTNATVLVPDPDGARAYREYDIDTGAYGEVEPPVGPGPGVAQDGFLLEAYAQDWERRTRHYSVTAEGDSTPSFEFEALFAWFGSGGELLVATPPEGGRTNVFVVDMASGDATFVSSAISGIGALSIAANEDWVAWTDNYCGEMYEDWGQQGTTKVLDRTTGEVHDLGEAFWLDDFTPDGRLGVGHFGAQQLVNLDTGEIEVALPAGGLNVGWSTDYRYASRGTPVGHGGHCPP